MVQKFLAQLQKHRIEVLRISRTTSAEFSTSKTLPGLLITNVITQKEEKDIIAFLNPLLSRKRYEGNHWDDVITKYKETELSSRIVPINIEMVMQSLRDLIRERYTQYGGQDDTLQFLPPHVIDLDQDGFIGPHVDSVKFSGDMIAGLSLASTRIMVLLPSDDGDGTANSSEDNTIIYPADTLIMNGHKDGNVNSNSDNDSDCGSDEEKAQIAVSYFPCTSTSPPSTHTSFPYKRVELHLPPRSLYLLIGPLRYSYSHSILGSNNKNTGPSLGLMSGLGPGCSQADPTAQELKIPILELLPPQRNEAVKRRLSIIFRNSIS